MKFAPFAILCLASIPAAHAQETSGLYAGFALGLLDYEEEITASIAFEDSTPAYRILGGFAFSDNFALEVGWGASSDLEDSFGAATITADYEVVTLRALGMMPFDNVSLLAGVGYYDAEITARGSIAGLGQLTAEDSDSGATLVGGVQFNLESGVSIRGEFEWFDTASEVDAWVGSLGVLFRF